MYIAIDQLRLDVHQYVQQFGINLKGRRNGLPSILDGKELSNFSFMSVLLAYDPRSSPRRISVAFQSSCSLLVDV